MTLALSSDTLSPAQIYDAADTILAQRLARAEGVAQVTINGAEKPAIRVRLDPVRLAAAGLAGQDVYNAIRGTNVLQPPAVSRPRTRAEIDRPERPDLAGRGTCAAGDQGRATARCVRLSDVASVINGSANTRLAAWNGTQPAILLTITKEAGANVIDTVDGIKALLPQLMTWLPPDIQVTVISDRTTTIRASVHDVRTTLLISIALVLLVVLIFMRRLVRDRRRRRHGAAVDLRHAGRHVVLRLFDRQFFADGADDLGRLRGRRRDRDDREHRPADGTRRRRRCARRWSARGRSASR